MPAAPPKPWEKHGAGGGVCPVAGAASTGAATTTAAAAAPAVPPKPTAMTSTAVPAVAPTTALAADSYANRYAASAATTGYGTGYGATGYGSTYGSAYGSSYSPYNRFGATGYGGYGSGYGSYGSPYGMQSGMGMGMGGMGMGMGMGPNGASLTQQMESGTAATFQLLQSVVSAFGGFSQMLESTFMATHSSFFAMIGVAEQFAHLRNWLGEVLSVFTVLRFLKRMLGLARGEDATTAAAGAAGTGGTLSAEGFRAFEANGGKPTAAAAPRPSKKPIVIFLLTVVGLPWLMTRLVRLITARQEAEARRLGLPPGAVIPLFDPAGQPLPQHLQPPGVDLALFHQAQQPQPLAQGADEAAALDPSKLTFVRALFPHASTANDEFELSFEKNDVIAVLTPKHERTEPGWWRGRLRDGRIGWFPSTHVQEIPMANRAEKDKMGDAVVQQQPAREGAKA